MVIVSNNITSSILNYVRNSTGFRTWMGAAAEFSKDAMSKQERLQQPN
jgi:hypothetical protein